MRENKFDPTDPNYQRGTCNLRCPQGHQWIAHQYREYGYWFILGGEEKCPECGKEEVRNE